MSNLRVVGDLRIGGAKVGDGKDVDIGGAGEPGEVFQLPGGDVQDVLEPGGGLYEFRGGAGSAGPAVDGDVIRLGVQYDGEILLQATRCEFYTNGFADGRLPEPLHLVFQFLPVSDIRVMRRAFNVHSLLATSAYQVYLFLALDSPANAVLRFFSLFVIIHLPFLFNASIFWFQPSLPTLKYRMGITATIEFLEPRRRACSSRGRL